MKKLITIFCIYNFLLFAQKPHWVDNRPVSNRYFIGIGFADKKKTPNYREVAQAAALNDLASQISVNISSELIDIMTEYSGVSEEYARSTIIMSTKQELEGGEGGYQREDDYDGEDFYYIYYRLPYTYFERFAELAVNSYTNYLDFEKNDLDNQLAVLVPALEYIYKAVRQDVIYEDNGKRINLRVEVPRLIREVLSNIEITAPSIAMEAYYGRQLDKTIDITVRNQKNKKPIQSLSMEIFFDRGDGKIVNDKANTNFNGKFMPKLTQITSKNEQQLLKAIVRLESYKAEINKGTYINNVLRGLANNSALTIGIKVSEFRKDRVGVLVVGDGLSTLFLSTLVSKFNNAYQNQTDFEIMAHREAEKILKRENFNIEVCTSSACQVEIGKKLGVDKLVYIKIIYNSKSRLINISTVLSEIYTKRVVKSDDIDLEVKKGESEENVIKANVSKLVERFWNILNEGTLIVGSEMANIDVQIKGDSDPFIDAAVKSFAENVENRTTPFTIPLIPGQYNLRFEKLGYVTKNEPIRIVKSDQRTITVELTKKTALNAFLRSAAIPGSGQYYSSDRQNIARAKMGKIIRIGLFSSLIASGYTYYSYNQAKTEYETAKNTYLSQTTLEEINSSRIIAQDKNQVMLDNQTLFTASLSLVGILWVGNAFEALLNFPNYGFSISANTYSNPNDNNAILFEPTISLSYNF